MATLETFVVHIYADLQQLPWRVIFGNPAYGRNWLSQHVLKVAPPLRHFFCPYRHFIDLFPLFSLYGIFGTFFSFSFFFLKNKMTKKYHVMCHAPQVTCHVSHVICLVSNVTCHMSHVTCHLSLTPRSTTTYLPLLTPQSSRVKGGQDPKISNP
jgi:hypothetical protein